MLNLFDNDEKIVAASPKIKHASLRHTVWWAGYKMNWSYLKFQGTMNLKKKRINDNPNIKGLVETDSIAGCCSFYRPKLLELSGFGDEEFFFGPEDIELSYRLKKFGKLMANLNTYTLHKIASSGEISGWSKRSYNETIGFLLLIKKTGNVLDKIIGYSYFIIRLPFFIILMSLNIRKKENILGFCLGCYDFFLKKSWKKNKKI